MIVEIRQEPPTALASYAAIPIAFTVSERLAVADAGIGGIHLVSEPVRPPYVKDYDADADHHPSAWARRFDLSRWCVLAARDDHSHVGGAVVAWATPGLDMLEVRSDLAVLWDLRVAPAHRRRGVGRALFEAAETWARSAGARWLKVETQNVNVPACRFYARQGAELGAVHRFAYPALPEETQLLWYKRLVHHEDVRCAR